MVRRRGPAVSVAKGAKSYYKGRQALKRAAINKKIQEKKLKVVPIAQYDTLAKLKARTMRGMKKKA